MRRTASYIRYVSVMYLTKLTKDIDEVNSELYKVCQCYVSDKANQTLMRRTASYIRYVSVMYLTKLTKDIDEKNSELYKVCLCYASDKTNQRHQ